MEIFLSEFGVPTLFLLFGMSILGLLGRRQNRKFVQRKRNWVSTLAIGGFSVASLLAITAWVMNTRFVTEFVYANGSLIWPFCLSLVALNGHPSVGVGLLVVFVMGCVNALYYALLASISWLWVGPRKVTG